MFENVVVWFSWGTMGGEEEVKDEVVEEDIGDFCKSFFVLRNVVSSVSIVDRLDCFCEIQTRSREASC